MTGEHTSERGGEISRRRCAIARTSRIPLKRERYFTTTASSRRTHCVNNSSRKTAVYAPEKPHIFTALRGHLATVRDSRGTEGTVIDCRERGELPMPPSCRRCANQLPKCGKFVAKTTDDKKYARSKISRKIWQRRSKQCVVK